MSRGGIRSFQKQRLSQALDARELKQEQLAALVGVAAGTISKWRSGEQVPELEKMERLAAALNIPAQWFTRPCLPEVEQSLFRSNASALARARKKMRARLSWGQEIAFHLEEFVDLPALNVPSHQARSVGEISNEEIEQLADEVRDRWQLGRQPIADLILAAEGAGIIVIREETGVQSIEGLSGWSPALKRPLILLSADKENAFRSRFDLAHEIGHLVLHRHIQGIYDADIHKLLEQQAHAFAGALLLPAKTFATEVRTPVSLDELLMLKRRWGVSAAAMIMRLRSLKMIDEDDCANLFKRKTMRWGAKCEPGDDSRASETPRLLRRSIELLVEENVVPLKMMPHQLCLAENDIEMLASLGGGYFNESAESRVIPMARLKPSTVTATHLGDSAVLPFHRNFKREQID